MSAWDQWVRFNYYAFLLRGEGHTALIDCGIDDLAAFNAMNLTALGERGLVRPSRREGMMLSALSDAGVRAEDVDTVCFTHFHADHAANARLFPRARFLVSAEGWQRLSELYRNAPHMVPDPLFPRDVVAYLRDLLDERLDLAPDGETTLPGVTIRHVGGHTADSAAFIIPTSAGSALIPGDTIWLYRNLEANIPVGSNVDVRACFDAMAWARQAADICLPTHDPELMLRYPDGVVAA
jgi:glyoxylase-like metal-dependent hydrolase (beta-lactamase superfamily II)